MITKTAEESATTLELIFSSFPNLPGHTFFVSDRGGEFMSDTWIRPMLEEYGFTPVRLQGLHKASLAERFM